MKHRAEVNKELLRPGDVVTVRGLPGQYRLTRRLPARFQQYQRWQATRVGGRGYLFPTFTAARVLRVVSYASK